MEAERTDTDSGVVCALRCVDAIGSTDDFETRLALWKAAKRYAARDRVERTAGLEIHRPLPRARYAGGESPAHELTC